MDGAPESKRIESIDQFRGLAIVLMVAANFLVGLSAVPPWLKHAPDVGLTCVDLIAPLFIFAIGLTYGRSYRKRVETDGRGAALGHFARRYLAILGIGAIIAAGEGLTGKGPGGGWEVLSAIGGAGLTTLLVIELPWWARLVSASVLLSGYQLMLDRFWLHTVLQSTHGGMLATLSWAAILIPSTVAGDLFHRTRDPLRRTAFLGAAAVLLLALGLGAGLVVPISKSRVSASYALVSLGASCGLFALVTAVVDLGRLKWSLLSQWGRNPLLLYIGHELLLGILVLPGVPGWYAEAPWWLTLVQGAALFAALTLLARLLARRGLTLSM